MDFYFVGVCDFLGKHIDNMLTPTKWLPIVVLVIAWWFVTKAIRSLQKDRRCQYLQESSQELYLRLLGAYRRIVFLSFLLVTVSWPFFFILCQRQR